jgi:DNA-binding NtrC family response regulator
MPIDKILIIDDDKSLGLSLKKILEKKGFIAEYVHSGKKAKEVLNQESFLVAILDIKLPDIDGIELLSELKEEYPFIEYIIITGYASINNVKLALNKEAFAFLEKPFEMSILESLVRSAIEKHRLKLELISSEKKYRGLFENTPYSIVLVNMEGVIIDCNAALEKLMGNDKCEIINRNYLDSPIFPLDYLTLFNEKFKLLIKGKTADPI